MEGLLTALESLAHIRVKDAMLVVGRLEECAGVPIPVGDSARETNRFSPSRNGDDLSDPTVHALPVIAIRTARGPIPRAMLILQRKRCLAELDDVRFRWRRLGGRERGTKALQRAIIAQWRLWHLHPFGHRWASA